VDPQNEYPERIAPLPGEPGFHVVAGPDDLGVERVEVFGLR